MQANPIRSAAVLLIDEDLQFLTNTAVLLAGAGYEVFCASDGMSARHAARHLSLDLVLCDVHVGDESGLDLCIDLQQMPGQEEITMMFISATQHPDIIRRVHDVGGIYYLRKPFDPAVLLELVERALWRPQHFERQIRRGHAMPPPPLSNQVFHPLTSTIKN